MADDGDGLAPQDIAVLFQPGVRGDNADDQKDTGMGLALARSMIEAQGGSLAAGCAPGRGCRFRVWLPGSADSGPSPGPDPGEAVQQP